MTGRRIEAVLFDVGGTLVEDRDFTGYAELARSLGLELLPESIGEAVLSVNGSLVQEGRSGVPPTSAEYWRRVLAEASGTEVRGEVADAFAERLARRPRSAHLFSDTRRTLERLRTEGRRLGVVSNAGSEAAVRELLGTVGILGYFATVVAAGTEGVAKPDPEIFRRAAKRLGVAPERAFYVGDLPDTDVRAAARAGLASIWLHRDGTGFGTDPPEITSLTELPRAIARLEAEPVK